MADQDEQQPHATPQVGPTLTDDELERLPVALQHRVLQWWAANGEADRAWQIAERLANRHDRLVTWLDLLADIAVQRRDVRAVRNVYEERLRKKNPPSAQTDYAQALLELGNLEGAREIADRLMQTHGDLQVVRSLRMSLDIMQGDSQRAIAEAVGKLEDEPESDPVLIDLAHGLLMAGDPAGAMDALSRVWPRRKELLGFQARRASAMAELLRRPIMAAGFQRVASFDRDRRSGELADLVDAALGRPLRDRALDFPWDDDDTELVDTWDGQDEEPHLASTQSEDEMGYTADSSDESHDDGRTGDLGPEYAEDFEPTSERRRRVMRDGDGSATRMGPDDPRVLQLLRDVWGFEELRDGQTHVINNMLAGVDTLAIMPTGAGKSLTFQLPAMLLDRPTLVVSPLIALMKDQLEHIPERIRARAVALNSSMGQDEQSAVMRRIRDGEISLIYVAPERFRSSSFVRMLNEVGVDRVVIDEAHCITQWGHDFRPDYLSIPAVLPLIGNPPILALTATASKETAKHIERGLGRNLKVVRSSSFRPNLRYEVIHAPNKDQKIEQVVTLCRETPGAAIVYVTSRDDTERFADVLQRAGVGALPYHAGLDKPTRSRNQEAFMRGSARVMVATTAFGMGVDKRDVRLVVHAGPSDSLEAYSQESGRAGRDGEPSRCVMLASQRDRTTLSNRAKRGKLTRDDVRSVYVQLRQRAGQQRWLMLDPSTLTMRQPEGYREMPLEPRVAITILDEAALVRRHALAPREIELVRSATGTEEATGLWLRVLDWLEVTPTQRTAVINVAEACTDLDIAPSELLAATTTQQGWHVRETERLDCLEMLPEVSSDGKSAQERMNATETAIERRAAARIDGMIAYQQSATCRHVVLGRHLGDVLEPCGEVCDVCDPPTQSLSAPRGASSASTMSGAEIALVVVGMVRSLRNPLGTTRLVQALQGLAASRVEPRSVQGYGALSDVPKSRIESVIKKLKNEAVLVVDPSDEYQVIRPGRSAAGFTLEEADRLLGGSRASGGADATLLERLKAWRMMAARRDRVAPFQVVHDATLTQIAEMRPRDEDELLEVHGIGPAKIEKYGAELLAIVREAD